MMPVGLAKWDCTDKLIATQAAHPEWFKHSEIAEALGPLLRDAGVDMSLPEKPFSCAGNVLPDE